MQWYCLRRHLPVHGEHACSMRCPRQSLCGHRWVWLSSAFRRRTKFKFYHKTLTIRKFHDEETLIRFVGSVNIDTFYINPLVIKKVMVALGQLRKEGKGEYWQQKQKIVLYVVLFNVRGVEHTISILITFLDFLVFFPREKAGSMQFTTSRSHTSMTDVM